MESERKPLKSDTKDKPKKDEGKGSSTVNTAGYFALFRYTTTTERFLLVIASILSIGHGALMPVFSIIFGDVTSDFTEDKPADQRRKLASETALKMFYVGLGTLAAAALSSFLWSYVGMQLNIRVRKMYFEAIVRQEMGWFDIKNPETMTTRYAENLSKFQGAIGQKNHIYIYATAMTLSGFLIGFIYGWWYALIVVLSFPIIMIGMVLFIVVMAKESKVTKESYEKAGGCAEQAFHAIKTVKILGGEQHELDAYSVSIEYAKQQSSKYGLYAGLSFGAFFAAIFVGYGLNFYLGSVLVDKTVYNHNRRRDYNVADIVTIFFAVITGGFAMGNTSPAAKAISLGKEAAYEIYQILDRESKIPIDNKQGTIPSSIEGDIQFNDVVFRYPSREDTTVLNKLNLTIPKGKKVALVGETGCGKSTTIQLLERYYDPEAGSVTIDGRDIKDYNLIGLRKFIGYVGQEPVLFAMTIRENLLLAKPDATEDELESVLQQANAYQFVMKLEKKLDTYVGAGGSQLSGGQKQRISIARSILQNPQILLLDEATSALDRRNEREIQATLDKFAANRTTVTIAHRLSTVMNSDIIYVLDKGAVVEFGSHTELIAKRGFYANLVSHQLGINNPEELELIKVDSQVPAEIEMSKHISLNASPDGRQEDIDIVVKSKELTLEEKKAKVKEDKRKAKEASKKLYKYLRDNYIFLITGCVFSLLAGALMPMFAIFLADMITILSKFDVYRKYYGYTDDSEQWKQLRIDTLWVAFWFLIMAVIAFIVNTFQISSFHTLGQTVTTRLRKELYSHFLTRDMEFFDNPRNSPGDLSSVLAKDCLAVNTIVSTSYGAILNGVGSFITGIVIAMIASWQIALVSLSVSPFIVLTGYIESKLMSPTNIDLKETNESKTFQEVSTNMRTVSSLNAQPILQSKFNLYASTENTPKLGILIFSSIAYGIGQFAMFAVYALTFYAGSEFVVKYGLGFNDLFRALFAIIFAAFGAGMGQQFAGNIGEAEMASKKIFEYLDIKNKITYSENPSTNTIKGHIEFRNVTFTYPQRNIPCFKNLSMIINPNQKVAFAGPSGGGKSTIFSLIYRFYDIDEGQILIDGVDIKEYDIKHLRSSLGMVAQEPILFNSTIRYNIKYNRPELTDAEMEEAAEIANATNFIKYDETLGGIQQNQDPLEDNPKTSPEIPQKNLVKPTHVDEDGHGYDRKVGLKGSKLSGGQKQRVAIARTVIRRPEVYMFDESTSALDTQSEKIVQDALNKLSAQKTSLAIAHRISTIKDCDVIFVIEGGKVVEQGRFDELISKKGAFYQLNKDR